MRLVASLLAYSALSAQAHAQSCAAIAEYGIYDTKLATASRELALSFSTWFCQKGFRSDKDASQMGLDLTLPIPDMPIQLGFNSDEQSWEEWYNEFCYNSQEEGNIAEEALNYAKTINPVMATALANCVNKGGAHAWVEQGAGARGFTFHVAYIPETEETSITTVKGFELSENATCRPMLQKDQQIGAGGAMLNCTRANNEGVDIALTLTATLTRDTPLNLSPIRRFTAPPERHPAPFEFLANQNIVRMENVEWGGLLVHLYSADTLHNGPRYTEQFNMVEYKVTPPTAGNYKLSVVYASGDQRGVRLFLNDTLLTNNALVTPTGSFNVSARQEREVILLQLKRENKLRIEQDKYLPHIHKLIFRPA